MAHKIYLAFGSNLGDREKYLQNAIFSLPPDVLPLRISPLYQSKPWGYEDQGDFLNLVVEADSKLDPLPLLNYVKSVEKDVGRQPTFKNGPREIDIDILFINDMVFNDPQLSIPHPELHKRAFVLAPLADLAPKLIHPSLDLSIEKLLKQIDLLSIQRLDDTHLHLEINENSQ